MRPSVALVTVTLAEGLSVESELDSVSVSVQDKDATVEDLFRELGQQRAYTEAFPNAQRPVTIVLMASDRQPHQFRSGDKNPVRLADMDGFTRAGATGTVTALAMARREQGLTLTLA